MATMTYLQAISDAMRAEMRNDDRVLVMGEDIGVFGGAFKVTDGFVDEFGPDRVMDTPLAESGIIGTAIGAAVVGMRPIAEMQFADFITCGFDQLVSVAGKMYYRQGLPVNITVRLPSGGGFSGGPFHSTNPEAWFMHAPGLKVVAPSTAEDAKGLLIGAVRDHNPVLFLEHKHLYRQTYNKAAYPGPNFMIPFGKAKIVREGTDVTIVTYGATVQRAFTAANQLAESGISVEVIDLRTLSPWDQDAVYQSVKKTNRAIVLYEDSISWGYGAEIAARIADDCFAWLDAPVKRIASSDTFVGYAPRLEDAILPQIDDIKRACEEIVKF
jgi:pyruvate/2-oxoglutarate/acetoin dehydrogenase E1 component